MARKSDGALPFRLSHTLLRTIKRQAGTMDTQAEDARDSAAASARVAQDILMNIKAQVEEMRLQRIQTVDAMKRQAYQMGRQVDTLDASVEAARISAEAAIRQVSEMKRQIDIGITKEEARFAVDFVWEGFTPPNEWENQEFPDLAPDFVIAIVNQGETKAFDATIYGAVTVTATRDYPSMAETRRLFPFPQMVEPGQLYNVPIDFGRNMPKASDVDAIRNESAFMHLFGYIAYTNAHGQRRRHPFRWIWKTVEFDVEDVDPVTGKDCIQTVDQSAWTLVELSSDREADQNNPN